MDNHERDIPGAGVYVAVWLLPRARRVRIGALGFHALPAGVYCYVGSAQRNLPARLHRHARRTKPLRWHIDYLARQAFMLGALAVAAPRDAECRLARSLAKTHMQPVPSFGSSDCHCPSHLFWRPLPLPETNQIRRR